MRSAECGIARRRSFPRRSPPRDSAFRIHHSALSSQPLDRPCISPHLSRPDFLSPLEKAEGEVLNGFTHPPSRIPWIAAGAALLLVTASAARAQQPSSAQIQQALQQPGIADQLRQRIQASGLTPDQIRSRLAASGYPSTLLDAYLGAGAGGVTPTPGALELQAVQALGLPAVAGPYLAVDTGIVRSRGGGAPSAVFGVDVFR